MRKIYILNHVVMGTPGTLENPSLVTFYSTELIELNCLPFQTFILIADTDKRDQAG